MRMPKFRAWDIQEKRMYNVVSIAWRPFNKGEVEVYIENKGWLVNDEANHQFVLTQCTEKEDKDGKEIYDGDVVEFYVVNMIWDEDNHVVKEHRPEIWRRVVKWVAPKFIINYYPHKVKVIGNIHQNPKLMDTPMVVCARR